MVLRIAMFSSSRRETILCMLSKNSSAVIVLKEARKRGISVHFKLLSKPYPGGALGFGGRDHRLEAAGLFTSKRGGCVFR